MIQVRRNDGNPEAVQAVQQADTVAPARDTDEHPFTGACSPEGVQLAFDRLQYVDHLGSPAAAGAALDRGMSSAMGPRPDIAAYGS